MQEITTETRKADAALVEIGRLYFEIVAAGRTTKENAERIGQLLTENKEYLSRDEFLPWMNSLPFHAEAQRLKQAAKEVNKCGAILGQILRKQNNPPQ